MKVKKTWFMDGFVESVRIEAKDKSFVLTKKQYENRTTKTDAALFHALENEEENNEGQGLDE